MVRFGFCFIEKVNGICKSNVESPRRVSPRVPACGRRRDGATVCGGGACVGSGGMQAWKEVRALRLGQGQAMTTHYQFSGVA